MSTAVTLFNAPNMAVPAHLAEAFAETENVLPRDTTPALTFRGKVWRLRQGGEEIVLTRMNQDGEKEPAPIVKVVILNMNQKRSRMYYAGPYEEGKNQSPSCWSSDGERPDKDCRTPVASTCASCPMSVKGSKITENQKETTACTPVKRLAVVPVVKLDMEPLLLKVPQTSIWDKNNQENEAQGYFAWDQYVDLLRQRGVKHTAAVVTRIKFDSRVAYPKLLFHPERWLEAHEVSQVVPLVGSEAVQKLLNGRIVEGGEEPEAPAAAPAPTPAPAVPPAPTPPLAAKPVPPAADDGDAFSTISSPATGATTTLAAAPAAPVAPAKPAAAPKPPKAPAPPAAAAPAAPAAPVPPKPAVAPPSADLAALAASWDD